MKKRVLSIALVIVMVISILPGLSSKAFAQGAYNTTISAAFGYTMIIKPDGSLWAWGNNSSGQLGDGTTTDRSRPVQVMTAVKAVSCGASHALALKTDGTLWAWGYNFNGQLGDGTTINKDKPVQILSNVAIISAGREHSMAIKTDGTLFAWGYNGYGQLGDKTTTQRTSPVQVMTGMKAVFAGYSSTMALSDNGTLYAWGDNNYGQFGNGTTTSSTTPVNVMTGVADVSNSAMFTMILKTDGTLWTCGSNDGGQIGNGTNGKWATGTAVKITTPVQVMNNVTSIAAGSAPMAVKTDGTLWAWGDNFSGQIGDGTTTVKTSPIQITTGVAAVSSGNSHTIAVKTDGTLWAWGNNSSGQLGDGTTSQRTTPVKVMDGVLTTVTSNDPSLPGAGNLMNFVKVATYGPNQFTDVPTSVWFAENVVTAYELGLMNGNSATTFNPTGNITIAETITLAARLHSIYHTGSDSFVMGLPWYQAYVDYAQQNSIISETYADYNRAATRAEFAAILSKSLPYEALQVINNVADNSIPDVPNSISYAPYIYGLYRAGILTGNDSLGTFKPDTTIGRHEASAIVARMAMTSLRKTFSLGKMIESISLNPVILKIDTQIPRYVKVEYLSEDGSNKAVTWTSSNPRVAAVESGWVSGISPGKAVITATAPGGQTATCNVTVVAKVNTTIAGVYSHIRDMIKSSSDSLVSAYAAVQYDSQLWIAKEYMSSVEVFAEIMKDYCQENPHTSVNSITKELDNLSKNASAAQDMIQVLESKGAGNYAWQDYTNAVDHIVAAQSDLIAFTKAFPSNSVDTTTNNSVRYYAGTNVATYECIIGTDCSYTYFLSAGAIKAGHVDYGDLYEYGYDEKDMNDYISAIKSLGWYLFSKTQVEGGTLYTFEKEGKMFGVYSKPSNGVIWIGNFA